MECGKSRGRAATDDDCVGEWENGRNARSADILSAVSTMEENTYIKLMLASVIVIVLVSPIILFGAYLERKRPRTFIMFLSVTGVLLILAGCEEVVEAFVQQQISVKSVLHAFALSWVGLVGLVRAKALRAGQVPFVSHPQTPICPHE